MDAAFLIELDDPSGVPRLTRRVLEELRRQVGAAARAPGVRGIVLTGTDRAFAAGADLAEVAALTPVEALAFSALGQGVMSAIERSPRPVVAAIRGWCLGGGFDLAMACHLRVAAGDATFAHPGGSLGLLTGWGGTARLPRLVGRAAAVELLASGRTLNAGEARALRLVQRVVPPTHALTTALELAARPPALP
jgi:enoyl-CoA hydratase